MVLGPDVHDLKRHRSKVGDVTWNCPVHSSSVNLEVRKYVQLKLIDACNVFFYGKIKAVKWSGRGFKRDEQCLFKNY